MIGMCKKSQLNVISKQIKEYIKTEVQVGDANVQYGNFIYIIRYVIYYILFVFANDETGK